MLKALIVDDVSIFRRIIQNMLQDIAEFEQAGNGEDAVSLALRAIRKENPFDLIFLDIIMPQLNGLEALRQIRKAEEKAQLQKRSKIVMLSGIAETERVREAVKLGCNSFILKPYSHDKVLRELEKLGVDVCPAKPNCTKRKRASAASKADAGKKNEHA